MLVKIAARQSDLARLQAFEVGRALEKSQPDIKIEYSFRSSLGDQRADDPLWKMPEKGVFTEDFVADLMNGRVDLVVHSWKDLPIIDREGTQIAATLSRADPRDVLLVRRDMWRDLGNGRLASGAARPFRILTSSPRRAYNLEPFLKWALPWGSHPPTLEFHPVRGNIATRVRKLVSVPREESFDALVVAKAALDRLLESSQYGGPFVESEKELREAMRLVDFVVLPLSMNPTAAAQGALAIEVRSDRQDLLDLCAKINIEADQIAVEAERRELAKYGGGCHQKIGVTILDRHYGRIQFLRGLTDSGQILDGVELKPQVDVVNWPRAKALSEIAPSKMKSLSRKPLGRAIPSARAFYVARANAWPAEAVRDGKSLVWTAGLQTWRQLAARGVWVNGTSDSLGESEETKIETLFNASRGSLSSAEISWVRLTHDATPDRDASKMKNFATYQVEIEPQSRPELLAAKYFFWKSGSQFRSALEVCPEIADRYHGSGPGQTHHAILHELAARGISAPALENRVRVFLNEDDFLKKVTPESKT